MPSGHIFAPKMQIHHTWWCVQNEADIKTSAHSNALAKACAWVEQRGGWAGALLAGTAAVFGVELLKRCAGSALGPILGHHAGAETGHASQFFSPACGRCCDCHHDLVWLKKAATYLSMVSTYLPCQVPLTALGGMS